MMICSVWSGCAGENATATGRRTAGAFAPDCPAIERTAFSLGDEVFDVAAHLPSSTRANGWGVLLIGGGVGNDLDWTVPGTLTIDGQTHQMSISGEPHADAPAISAELAGRGFVVVHWSTIARGDPLMNEWPVRATPRSFADLLDQSRSALATLRGIRGVRADRIVLVGHSLGAARAFTIAAADNGVRAVVALAPAYFTKQKPAPKSVVNAGMRRGQDVASERQIPVLAVFGSLDRSPVVDAAGASTLAGAERCPGLEVVIFKDLGHQLGPQVGERCGPVSPEVLIHVGRWLDRIVHLD